MSEKLKQICASIDVEQAKARDSWKVFQIMAEFVDGFQRLANIRPSVSIFGSARFEPDHPYCKLTEVISRKLAEDGISVVSGGGPGIMQAANKGAGEAGGTSVGLNIQLPHEDSGNPFQNVSLTFKYFFARKVMFVKYASAYIVMPGGFGTLDETAEILTLIQTGKSRRIPIILVGTEFWQGFVDWLRNTLLPAGTISEKDFDLFHVLDDADDVIAAIYQFYDEAESPSIAPEDQFGI
ncbi:MAG: TIGR00730 family Rossman fold protein [Pseudomonadota bacterium]